MNKYFYISRIIIIYISIFCVFTNSSEAGTSKGYSVIEPATQNNLIYKTLENSETYSDIKNCFNKIELTRYPEIVYKLNNQSICFNKYSIAGELKTKLDNTNKSLEKLNLYKQITELALNNALEVSNSIGSGSTGSIFKYDLFIIPKGELVETKINKNINHKPQCKIDSIYNSKTPVQSCENKEVVFSIFVENTQDQINRIKNNFTDLQQIIKKFRPNTIETISLNMKSDFLANDLTLFNTENFESIKNKLPSIKDTSSFVEIIISDNNQINSDNPSHKIVNIRVKYPELDSNLNLINQESFDLPTMYLETFEKNIIPKIITKLKEHLTEYNKIIKDLSKNKQTLLTSLSTIETDKSCYDNSNKSITVDAVQELNIDQNMSSFEKQTFISFIGNILNSTISGIKSTFLSVSDNTKQLITLNPSPTPTPGIYIVINPSTSPTINTSPTPYPSSTPRPSSTPTFTVRPTPYPSSTPTFTIKPTPYPSSTPIFTAKPTPTYSYSPTPTPTNTAKPSPTPTNSIYSTPVPTPTYSPTPTPTPTPSYSPRISTTITPTPSVTPVQ